MTELLRERLISAYQLSLPMPANAEPYLRSALQHVLETPGSLVRPEIVVRMCEGLGVQRDDALALAIALEYFHTASLIFDDLPAMDNAAERRGQPCVHQIYGEATSMLVALALINRAYAMVWRSVAPLGTEHRTQALDYLERHLGTNGLLNGQSMDLHFGRMPRDRATVDAVALGKTVPLIRLTLVLPAIVGGASAAELHLLERTALFWGLSYQIVDDLKDVLQSTEESGKTPSRDALLGRPNVALALGVEAAAERLRRMIRIGDQATERLIASRASFSFLQRLRAELNKEATALMKVARTANARNTVVSSTGVGAAA